MDDDFNLELLSSEEDSNHSSSFGSAKLPSVSAETSEATAAAGAHTEERNNNKARSKVQTVDGVDLFPPSGSKGPRASKAWAYGGLKKDEKGKLLTDKMYCSLCPKIFKFLEILRKFKVTFLTKEDIVEQFKREMEMTHKDDEVEDTSEPKKKKMKWSFFDDDDDVEDDRNRSFSCKWKTTSRSSPSRRGSALGPGGSSTRASTLTSPDSPGSICQYRAPLPLLNE